MIVKNHALRTHHRLLQLSIENHARWTHHRLLQLSIEHHAKRLVHHHLGLLTLILIESAGIWLDLRHLLLVLSILSLLASRSPELEYLLECDSFLSLVTWRPKQEVFGGELDRAVILFAQLQLLDELKGDSGYGTNFTVRLATEYEQAVSVLVCFDCLFRFQVGSDAATRYFELRSTAVEHAHHISVFLTSHCAQLLLEGVEDLHRPLCKITSGLCIAFHDAVACIVDEYHSLLAGISVVSNLEVAFVYLLRERLEVYIPLDHDL